MKFQVFTFVFILSLAAVCGFAQTKDEEALKALVKNLTEAQKNYQPEVLDQIFTADYIEISPVGEFDPREKVLGFYKPAQKPPAGRMKATIEASDFSIRIYNKFAIVITRLDFAATMDGKALPSRRMRATLVCRKEKGAWKIASAQYTGIR